MPTFEELTAITGAQIRAFDAEAKAVIREYQDAGWRGYLSNNGHAIMLSPDGQASTSISGHADRHKTKSARAELRRWQRAQRQQTTDAPTEKPSNIKGVTNTGEDGKPFRCDFPECGKTFVTALAANLHRQRTHDGLTCPECKMHFPPELPPSAYAQHREAEHGIAPQKKRTAKPEVETVKANEDATSALTSEEDARGLLTSVLAILAPSLLGDVERLRLERDRLQEKVNELEQNARDNDARMALLREALGA